MQNGPLSNISRLYLYLLVDKQSKDCRGGMVSDQDCPRTRTTEYAYELFKFDFRENNTILPDRLVGLLLEAFLKAYNDSIVRSGLGTYFIPALTKIMNQDGSSENKFCLMTYEVHKYLEWETANKFLEAFAFFARAHPCIVEVSQKFEFQKQ